MNQRLIYEIFPPIFHEMARMDVFCAILGAKSAIFSMKSVDFGLFFVIKKKKIRVDPNESTLLIPNR